MRKIIFVSFCLAFLMACQENENEEQFSDWISLAREGLSDLVINTNDEVTLELNQQAKWSVSATFSSGAIVEYSDKVQWSSDSPTFVAVSETGQVTAIAEGTAQISAAYKGFQDIKTVTVSTATLESIEYAPSLISMSECTSSNLRARGTYSDGTVRNVTRRLIWESSDQTLASINVTDAAVAQITSHKEGSVTVSSSDQSGTSESFDIAIEDTLSGLTLTPNTLSLASGETAKFTASGQFNDGSFLDISDASEWSLTSTDQSEFVELNVDSPGAGRVTALVTGEAGVSVSCGGLTVSQAGTVKVNDPITLTELKISEVSDPFVLQTTDSSESLSVFAYYSDSSNVDVSADAVWSIVAGDADFIDVGSLEGVAGDIVLSDDIGDITENKSVVVRATFEGLIAYIEVIVEAP